MLKCRIFKILIFAGAIVFTLSIMASASPNTIIFTANSNAVYFDETLKHIDVKPYINEKGNFMIPVGLIANAFGEQVYWNAESKSMYIVADGSKAIDFTVDEYYVRFNNSFIEIETCPVMQENRIMIPAKLLSDILGYHIKWNEVTKQLTVNYEKPFDMYFDCIPDEGTAIKVVDAIVKSVFPEINYEKYEIVVGYDEEKEEWHVVYDIKEDRIKKIESENGEFIYVITYGGGGPMVSIRKHDAKITSFFLMD